MMKNQQELRIDPFGGRHFGKDLPARNVAVFLFVSLLLAVVMLAAPITSSAEVSVSVSVAVGPPALPVYVQPVCPAPGLIWIPGYWAWDPDFGYYWVPGLWAPAPFVGALWTPGYWAWSDGVYIWREGYWGPVVGFYGGVNYGYGYTGTGYYGGYWRGGTYYYNRTVNNINVTNITTVYSRPVSNKRPIGASFNGGPGGTTARPSSEQLAAARQQRSSLISEQRHQIQVARSDPKQRVAVNRGRPEIAATTRPGEFKGPGIVRATRAGAPYKAQTAPPSKSPQTRTAPGERGRTPVPGSRIHPPSSQHERMAPGTSPDERIRTPRPGPKMSPPATQRERIAPGSAQRGPERRGVVPGTLQRQPQRQFNESRPAQRVPKTTKQPQQKENNRGEQREMREAR